MTIKQFVGHLLFLALLFIACVLYAEFAEALLGN